MPSLDADREEMKKPKVLHITTAFRPHAVGGAEVVVTTLARAQAAAGYQTFVAHLSPSAAPRYEEDGVSIVPLQHRNLYDIKVHATKSAVMRRINKFYTYYNPGVMSELAALISEIKPDIVHTHSMVDLSTQIWRIARQRGASVVHTLHDYDLLCGRGTLYSDGNCQGAHAGCWVHKHIKQIPLANVNAFAAISDFVLAEHIRLGAFGAAELARAKTIWNPLPSAIQHAAPPTYNNRPLRLGFLGRLVPEKGIGFLLDELHGLARHDTWNLAVGGVAPNSDDWLRQKAVGLPVKFIGWVDTAKFLSEIDVLIVPSLWNEPFGLTVIEGLLAGKIVLGSRMGAIPEIMAGLGEHVLFDGGVSGSLTKILTRVIDSPETYRPMQSVLSDISRRLDAQLVMMSYEDLYLAGKNGVA